MSGFYGSSLIAPMGFEIDLRYPNKTVMDKNADSDGIMVGRYVLIDYYQKDSDQTSSNTYQDNYQKDIASSNGQDFRSYDSTLWVKIYDSSNKAYKYVLVADLNGADVGVELVPPGRYKYDPDNKKLVDFYLDEKLNIRYLKLPAQWNIELGGFDYGSDGFKKTVPMDPPSGLPSAEFIEIDRDGDDCEDTKSLKISIPDIGYAISQVYDEVYGKDRSWVDSTSYPVDKTTDPCLVQEVKLIVDEAANVNTDLNDLLDKFYGEKIDVDGDGEKDKRPWEDGVPTTDGNALAPDGSNLDTSYHCALLDVTKAVIDSNNSTNTILDKFYGKNRQWIDESNYPDADKNGTPDYSTDTCFVSKILQATENANKALESANTNITNSNAILDKFYGIVKDSATNKRTWEDETKYPDSDGDGIPDYDTDPCLISKIEKASLKTEKMLDQFYGADIDKDGVRPWENNNIPESSPGIVDYSSGCVLSENHRVIGEMDKLLDTAYGDNRLWANELTYPKTADGNNDYDQDKCLISNILEATELANEASSVLEDFYGKDKTWFDEASYPDADGDGIPDYDTNPCIVSKIEKLLDDICGVKEDTDGDGKKDKRPWENLADPPMSGGNVDYSSECVLSKVSLAIENSKHIDSILDKMYGTDSDGDGKRDWEDEKNYPKDATTGNVDYKKSPCVISKVEKLLTDIFGMEVDSTTGDRTWENNNVPLDSDGNIDYAKDKCLISEVKEATANANEAASVLNTFTSTFNEITDGSIPYVKIIDGKKEFYGMSLIAGEDINLEEILDPTTGTRSITISIARRSAEILPFPEAI